MKIKDRLSNRLAHNTGMKVLAFFCALFLWFYVAILQDPVQTSNIRNIPIKAANTSEIRNKGLIIVSNVEESLNLKVKGSRSAMSKLNSKSVTAIIDLANFVTVGEHEVPIKVNFPINDVIIENQSMTTIRVDIDTLAKRSIDITIQQKGELSDDEELDEIVLETRKVEINGPKKTLDLIDKAMIEVDLSKDREFTKEVKLYSSNGSEINDDLLTFDGQIKGSVKIK